MRLNIGTTSIFRQDARNKKRNMEIRLQNKKFPVKGFEMKPKTAFVLFQNNQ